MKAAALVALLLPALAPAQGGAGPPSLDRHLVDRLMPEVQTRLRSEKPSTVAWGAHMAARFGLDESMPELRKALSRAEADDPVAYYLLDAMVRLGAEVESGDVEPFLEGPSSVPALVLLARDVPRHRDLLSRLYGAHSGHGDYLAWRSAGNLLAWKRDPGFAEHLLDGLRLTLEVEVVDRAPEVVGMGPGGAGAAVKARARTLPDGFPPLPRYRLVTEGRPGYRLLAPGPHPVFWVRSEDPDRRWTTDREGGFSWDVAMSEHQWLRFMAGMDTDPNRCLVTRSLRVIYEGPEDYRRRLQAARRELRDDFDRLVHALEIRNALSPDRATAAKLHLRLEIEDLRNNPTEPLPPVDG